MNLREVRLPDLIERRDELQRQVNAINSEVARRYRERFARCGGAGGEGGNPVFVRVTLPAMSDEECY